MLCVSEGIPVTSLHFVFPAAVPGVGWEAQFRKGYMG